MESFDTWFKELVNLAKERGILNVIDQSNPDSYLEYFDDGDSIETVLQTEYDLNDNT